MQRMLLAIGLSLVMWGSVPHTPALAQAPVVVRNVGDEVVRNSRMVLDEIMSIPARQIPTSLLRNAQAVAIIPNVLKGGFVIGVRHGRGVVLTRDDTGAWQPPIFVSLTGGSIGWQAGIQSTDVVLVFRTRTSVNSLMSGKLTVGADASAAAGPVGRQAAAATDGRLSAEILSYSRSRGLFAGVSIDGSVLQVDNAAGQAFYGGPVLTGTGQTLQPNEALPESAVQLMQRLTEFTSGTAAPVAESGTTIVGTPVMESNVRSAEEVRQQLVAAWMRLAELLDEPWRRFLALPAGVANDRQSLNVDALHKTLQDYSTVSQDPRYASLTQRAEFQTVLTLLTELANIYAAQPTNTLQLPPPPGASIGR